MAINSGLNYKKKETLRNCNCNKYTEILKHSKIIRTKHELVLLVWNVKQCVEYKDVKVIDLFDDKILPSCEAIIISMSWSSVSFNLKNK